MRIAMTRVDVDISDAGIQTDHKLEEKSHEVSGVRVLPDKLVLQKKTRKLEGKRDEAWREYDDSAKIIEEKKDALIDMVEARLKQQTSACELFTISFEIH